MMRALLFSLILSLSVNAAQAEILVTDARSPALLKGSRVGVIYFTVENAGSENDRLLSLETDVAERVELHENKLDGDVMSMVRLDSLPLPAGKKIALVSGGTHIMLFGMKKAIDAGDTLPLTLNFEKAEKILLNIPVTAAGHDHH